MSEKYDRTLNFQALYLHVKLGRYNLFMPSRYLHVRLNDITFDIRLQFYTKF